MDDGTKLEETILALIAQALPGKLERDAITPDLKLRRDLGLDSLGMVSLLTRCGEGLGVDPDDLVEVIDVERMNTVGDVVAMVAKLTRGAST
jgi:acyl carrier protein